MITKNCYNVLKHIEGPGLATHLNLLDCFPDKKYGTLSYLRVDFPNKEHPYLKIDSLRVPNNPRYYLTSAGIVALRDYENTLKEQRYLIKEARKTAIIAGVLSSLVTTLGTLYVKGLL